jgi:hypothetical protein
VQYAAVIICFLVMFAGLAVEKENKKKLRRLS